MFDEGRGRWEFFNKLLGRVGNDSEEPQERRRLAQAAVERARSSFQKHTWLLARYEQALAGYRKHEREHNEMVGLHRRKFAAFPSPAEIDYRQWERSKGACDIKRLLCDLKWEELKKIETELNLAISRMDAAHLEMAGSIERAGLAPAEWRAWYPEFAGTEPCSGPGQFPRDLRDVPPLEASHR